MNGTVAIDCFPESVENYPKECAIVAIDVIRATTTAVTGVSMGRRCFPVDSLEAAQELAPKLHSPLLVGELAGGVPPGFDMNNSPAELALRNDISRPMILLSTSGTKLVCGASGFEAVYLACFRNYASVAKCLVGRHGEIAVIGAGSKGEFREEDQMCCAWIARDLIEAGYALANDRTGEIVERWRDSPPEACLNSNSANYLRRSGQLKDLDFILSHINDLDGSFMLGNNEIIEIFDGVTSPERAKGSLSNFLEAP